MKNWKSHFKNNFYFLSLIWNISPTRAFFAFLTSYFEFSYGHLILFFFMQYLFGAKEKERSFEEIIIFLSITIIVEALIAIFNSWYKNSFIPKNNIKVNYFLKMRMFKKAQSVDLVCYESPCFYDTYNRAMTEVDERSISILETCATFIFSLISSLFVLFSMLNITYWALLFVLFPLIGNLFLSKKICKIQFDIEQDKIPFKRKNDYVNRVIYFRKHAGDMRLTKAFEILKKIYCSSMDS